MIVVEGGEGHGRGFITHREEHRPRARRHSRLIVALCWTAAFVLAVGFGFVELLKWLGPFLAELGVL